MSNRLTARRSPPPVLFGLYDTVNLDRYGNALGGHSAARRSRCRPRSTRRSTSRRRAPADLNPVALLSELTSALTSLSTGSINNATVRSAGLCLLSGYFLSLGSPTLAQLYPTHAAYVSKYTTAANAAVAAGFLTPADAATAIAAVQASTQP